jgi:hypothetical protein
MLLVPGTVAAQLATLAPLAPSRVADRGATAAPAGADSGPQVRLGAFLDTYYAWDGDRPPSFDRAYTTQPARHAEFNVNLAFVEASLTGPRYRGRLALQWGTSVQSNYAGEPQLGSVSGPAVSQFLQEATLGYQLAPTLWLDGGVFFAHTGMEGWISRDNLAYTRSLMADFSPYYEAGVKLTWAASSAVTAQFVLVNGWQNISNYNTPPATGVRVDVALSPHVTLSYDNFVGNATADSLAPHVRFYQDFMAQLNPPGRWQFAACAALGLQSRSTASGGTASWYGAGVFVKYHVTPRLGVVARLERYDDPDQVIVKTGLPAAFRTDGASLGLDVALTAPLLWRTEVRGFRSRGAVWPTVSAGQYRSADWFSVTSLSLRF